MEHEVSARPSFALLTVSLEEGESLRAESGAMVSHDTGIEMETNATGGFLKSIRRAFGGESFFQNTFRATAPGDVQFAPPLPGDISHVELEGDTLYVQSGSYLAGDAGLDVDTEFGGTRTFFGGEGLFLLKVTGTGPLFLSSYGAIEEISLNDRESFVVDTGHVVAFEDTAEFTVRRVGGLRSTLTSGEGLVCEFGGSGTVWVQSRSPDAFLSWLIPKLPQPSPNTQ
ncbi:TIGR00266 family protein [Halogeometricum sp. S1BR25-6]|uniref:TIGR00266 family protein n=1 Tax=Halogeometricum salsisoli TaxID=2950536 RepID=A0ABU2GCS5_9EURY|nr:TIGR00266 family protein [Halogeometricum sp. S1BR25-6]MDS0298620.1 TIGR00266 family protein [Halogeometricum sp. S1BR25-6]